MKLRFGKPKEELAENLVKPTKLPKEKKPPKIKTHILSAKKTTFGRKARFTLLIGDEGAILVHMKGTKVLSRQFVADASDSNLAEFAETIEKDDLAPITMIIDSVDQVFVQQTLPPVSSMSVKKLINRRLERDFKPADIKGALVLGKDKTGRKDWNFLMVSVEKSPQIMLWLDFIMRFNNRFRGIVLLAVEAEIFLKNLERAMGVATKIGTGAEWKILVSHNKVGGFRQIILRNGRLIFTRLALPVGEPTPEVIAGNIEQEMVSTIEYLKRFGYNPKAGLNLYIIASEEVCARIEPRRFDAASFHAMPPHKVAEYLGIVGATQAADQFGDVVMAAAVGGSSKNVLKLTTIESRLFDKLQQLKLGLRLLTTFAALGMVVYGAFLGYEALLANNDMQDAQQQQSFHRQTIEAIKQKIIDSKLDVDAVNDQVDMYTQIKSESRTPLPFFATLQNVIKPPVLIKGVTWKLGDAVMMGKVEPSLISFNVVATSGDPNAAPLSPAQMTGGGASTTTGDTVTAVLKLEFPTGLNSAPLFKTFADDFLKQLNVAMPNYIIAYTVVPQEYVPKAGLQIDFSQQEDQKASLGQKPVQIEVTIRGKIPSAVTEGGAP